MINQISLLLILILFSSVINAQGTISGKVIDKQTNKPIAGASIYISNTSLGCVSNQQGEFNLKNVPDQPFDLVVSTMNFETYSQHYMSNKIQDLTISLQPRVNELESVTVASYEKDGWKTWGKFFLENFIGTSINAADCHILNYKSIRFRQRKKEQSLNAYALEPLIIENKALGYRIKYDMKEWTYNFKSHYLYYYGYPLFEDIEGNAKQFALWSNRRKDAYEISLMYFLRSIFNNSVKENGFEIRRLQQIPNKEKKRVQPLYNQYLHQAAKDKILNAVTGNNKSSLSADSIKYYQSVMSQPDAMDVLYKSLLPVDSVARKTNGVVQLFCKDILFITVPGKQEDFDYWHGKLNVQRDSCVTAKLQFVNQEPVNIYGSGHFYPGANLVNMGYWSYSERICNMLLLDYEPAK